jgi:ComF family protein
MIGADLGLVNTCGACLKEPPAMQLSLAAVDYGYPWDRLLAQLKFRQEVTAWISMPGFANPAMARILASIMLANEDIYGQMVASDWIVPMPLHANRQRDRGFNQSLELARALIAGHAERRLLKSRLLPQALLRVRDTPAQVGLSGRERRRNLDRAFAVDPDHVALLSGRSVVLIDDVATTGTSLSTAAQALRQAGVTEVVAIVFARTTDG